MLSSVRTMLAGCMNGVLGRNTTLVPRQSPPVLSSIRGHQPCNTLLRQRLHCQPSTLPNRSGLVLDLPHATGIPSSQRHATVSSAVARRDNDLRLDKDQLAAALADGSRVIRVLAGPGSGKTTLLVARVQHLVQTCGVDPGNIMVVTFTKKAADELKNRLSELLSDGDVASMSIGTFHSICSRLIRSNVAALNGSLKPNFTCCDDDDQKVYIKQVLKKIEGEDEFNARTRENRADMISCMTDQIDQLKCKVATTVGLTHAQVASAFGRPCIANDDEEGWSTDELADLFIAYQKLLQSCNSLDFNDLLGYAVHLLSENPDVLSRAQDKYRHVLVDEFQDTNIPQYEFLRLVAGSDNNLFVVGDIHQCIYSWRGAVPQIMERNLVSDYSNVQTLYLSRNYRSVPEVVLTAEAMLSHEGQPPLFKPLIPMRSERGSVTHHTFTTCKAEAEWVMGEIQKLIKQGVNMSEIAVLYSQTRLNGTLKGTLADAGVKFKVLGEKPLLDRADVKDVLAYLRWAQNPHDVVALERLKDKPRRGVGKATLNKLKDLAESKGISWAELLFSDLQDVWLSPEQVRHMLQQMKPSAAEPWAAGLNARQLLEKSAPAAPLRGVKGMLDEQGLKLAIKQVSGIDELRALLVLMRSTARYASVEETVEVVMKAGGYRAFHIDNTKGKPLESAFLYLNYLLRFIRKVDTRIREIGPVSDEQVLVEMQLFNQQSINASPRPVQQTGEPQGPAHPMQAVMACLEFLTLHLSEGNLPEDSDEKADSVKLSTLHSSKGLEYSVVFMIGLEQDHLPRSSGEREQIRLAYVGCTRAKDHLHLSTAENRRRYTRYIELSESEFIGSLRRKKQLPVRYKIHQGQGPPDNSWRR